MLRREVAFPCCVSASRGPSRALDEPVNPRKREGESSPVNAEVMTGVATLKDPRQSAIAGTASRSSSLSLSYFSSLSLPLSHSAPCLLGNSPPLASSFDSRVGQRMFHAALSIMLGGRQKVRSARQRQKLKSPTPKKRLSSFAYKFSGELSYPAEPVPESSSDDYANFSSGIRTDENYPSTVTRYLIIRTSCALSHRSWSRENRIHTVKTDLLPRRMVTVSNTRVCVTTCFRGQSGNSQDTIHYVNDISIPSCRDISCLHLIT